MLSSFYHTIRFGSVSVFHVELKPPLLIFLLVAMLVTKFGTSWKAFTVIITYTGFSSLFIETFRTECFSF